jgi:CheY-like chemotaxis protein
MNDENKDEKTAELAASESQLLATRSTSLVRRGLQSLANKRRKRIVKVDDEEAMVDATVQLLAAEGYEVKSTTRPSEAVALIADFQPDVALIDLVMPEIDGFKLSQQLQEQFPALTIVLTNVWLRGREIDEELHRLLDAGIVRDILDAPFEREDLIQMMKDWLGGVNHFEPSTGLLDGKQFEMELSRNAFWHKSTTCIFIELRERGCLQTEEWNHELSVGFLRELGATLRQFARDGRAYRCEPNKFAVLSREACAKSAELSNKIGSLLNGHELEGRFSAAIEVVANPAPR